MNTVRIARSVSVAVGVALALYYLRGGAFAAAPVGVLLMLAGAWRAPVKTALAGAGVIAVLIAAAALSPAGPLGSFIAREWAYVLIFVAACASGAALTAVLSARHAVLAALAIVLAGTGLVILTAGFKNTITPVAVSTGYVTMRDGVQLATNVYLPRGLKRSEKLPTIFLQTRYHRAQVYRFPFNLLLGRGPEATPIIDHMVNRGYAYVTVDVRGTGASTGLWIAPFTAAERADGQEMLAWITAQPWSNGIIGAEGVSYNGSAAEFLLTQGAGPVKAVMALFTLYDAYTEIQLPGGIFTNAFHDAWQRFNQALDADKLRTLLPSPVSRILRGVQPVSSGWFTTFPIPDHSANGNTRDKAAGLTFKDDVSDGFSTLQLSLFTYQDQVRASGAAIHNVTGWFDGAYQYAGIQRFLTTPNPGSRLLIGPWAHGASQIAVRCRNPAPDKPMDMRALAGRYDARGTAQAFFDRTLKGIAVADEAPVRYFTICAEKWRSAQSWPPPAEQRTLYFAPDGTLGDAAPSAEMAADTYTVDLTASSGQSSRWASYVNLERRVIGYPDRKEQDEKLLTYTSAPLTEDTEVTGHPVITLHVTSTADDGTFFVYLEDVDEAGNVDYVTEGQLRALHRKLSDGPAPYKLLTPYRTFARADAEKMVPGQSAELVFDLWPISYLFRKGHRIRIAVAGADRDNFALLPGDAPTWQVHRDAAKASRIVLPVVR